MQIGQEQQKRIIMGYGVFVKVVVISVDQVIKWKKQMSRLSHWVAAILKGNDIKEGTVVECIHHPVAQLCKILCIVIEETIPSQTSRKLQVKVKAIISRERYEQNINPKGQKPVLLGGLNSPELYLKQLVSFPLLYPQSLCQLGLESFKGVLLTGPPGCGKTSLVKKVAFDCKALLVTVRGPELCHSEPGKSEMELRKVFENVQLESEEGPAILFIDEIDSICPKRHSGISAHSRRLLAQLLILMDGLDVRNNFVVIGATNRPDLLDCAVRRPGRFDKEIFIGIPTFEQREEIFRVLTRSLRLASDVDLTQLALQTPGYVGGDIQLLCQEATLTCLRKHSNTEKQSDIKVSQEDFLEVLKQLCPSSQKSSSWQCDVKPVNWSEIGGLEQVKRRIQIAVEWPLLYPEAFARMGISKPRGVLLFGPPGCCKTTLVRAAATNCHATFLSVSGAQIFSPLVGDSERAISQVFHHARLGAPSIVFIDEVDSVVGKRAASKHQNVQERVLSTLLNELDGVGIRIEDKRGVAEHEGAPAQEVKKSELSVDNNDVLVVAATNRPDLVDEALLRPGRFDVIIYVPPPDVQGRKSILKVLTKNMPVVDCDLTWLAENTQLFSGADLENLCREAALEALEEDGFEALAVRNDHFLCALRKIKPSLTRGQLNYYSILSTRFINKS